MTAMMIQRHHEARRLPVRMPAKLRTTSSSGARNPMPKTRIVRRKKDRYQSTETMFSTFSGVNPSSSSKPIGRIV